MSNACITIDCKDWISTVTIDNPPANYLDRNLLAHLNKTVSDMLASKADLRVVLLKAKGRNFSAGIDYPGFVKMTKDEAGHFADVGYHLLRNIESLPVPVIAAVKGETTGAGLGLALAADIRIAAADAVFSFPEAQFGVPPVRVPGRVDRGAAGGALPGPAVAAAWVVVLQCRPAVGVG